MKKISFVLLFLLVNLCSARSVGKHDNSQSHFPRKLFTSKIRSLEKVSKLIERLKGLTEDLRSIEDREFNDPLNIPANVHTFYIENGDKPLSRNLVESIARKIKSEQAQNIQTDNLKKDFKVSNGNEVGRDAYRVGGSECSREVTKMCEPMFGIEVCWDHVVLNCAYG